MPNESRHTSLISGLTLVLLTVLAGGASPGAQVASAVRATAPKTMRLYVFDCGVLNITTAGVERYHVTPTEVGESRMSVPCFLIAHPRGTLMWDLGVIPDAVVEAQTPGGARSNVNPTAAGTQYAEIHFVNRLARRGARPPPAVERREHAGSDLGRRRGSVWRAMTATPPASILGA